MAKFTFYEISCGRFTDRVSGAETEYDKVNLMFSKRVKKQNMRGEKGEMYSVSVSDLPYLFGEEKRFPSAVNDDYSRRIEAVSDFLEPYLGKSCIVEQIKKNDRDIISYIEFEE